MNKGDIILVPFPFTDLSSNKTRPALIISKNKQNFIVLAITSKRNKGKQATIDQENLNEGQLPLRSFVQVDKVATLNKNIVKKVVGKLKNTPLSDIIDLFTDQF